MLGGLILPSIKGEELDKKFCRRAPEVGPMAWGEQGSLRKDHR
jgi:hypothetical protein